MLNLTTLANRRGPTTGTAILEWAEDQLKEGEPS